MLGSKARSVQKLIPNHTIVLVSRLYSPRLHTDFRTRVRPNCFLLELLTLKNADSASAFSHVCSKRLDPNFSLQTRPNLIIIRLKTRLDSGAIF
jgi:hypothetical protein